MKIVEIASFFTYLNKMKKRYLFYIMFFLVPGLWGFSQESFKITHGPWLCDMNETGVSIVWMTNKNAVSWVEIAPDDESNFYAKDLPRYFDSQNGRKQAATRLHKVRLENLQPGTKYRYAVFSREVLNWETDSRIIYGVTVAN